MNRDELLARVRRAHEAWEQIYEGRVEPDPQYDDERSQYPEGILDVSGTPEMDADLNRRIGVS